MSKISKLYKLEQAAKKLNKAIDLLEEIQLDRSDHAYICPDVAYSRTQLVDVLKGDGQGGIEGLIRIVDRELKAQAPQKESKK